VRAHGVLDSLTFEDLPSFLGNTYPSRLPRAVLDEMLESARCVISHIGLDDCGFNIEYFFDFENKHIALLKINSRILQSRAEIFRKVDGSTNLKIIIDLASGNPSFRTDRANFSPPPSFTCAASKTGGSSAHLAERKSKDSNARSSMP
jgi:hypothetical protein